jgi:pyrroloquinoline quinone biosynthesis protein B
MIETILLGTAQDGGVPHAGCECPTCAAAWSDPALQQHPACLGLVDHSVGKCWLIDATPAFPTQLHYLQGAGRGSLASGDREGTPLPGTGESLFAPTRPPTSDLRPLISDLRFSGIFLSHAHIGHYTGLIHLGREVMNTDHLPVYATPRMAAFLWGNAPWSGLVEDGNIDFVELEPGLELALSPDLHITPIAVPHREEYSDTVAYLARGPKRSLFYCPDIDGWDDFDVEMTGTFSLSTKASINESNLGNDRLSASHLFDIALLDGSFFSPAELPGRDLSLIPHPLVTDTVAKFGAEGLHLDDEEPTTNVYFIHLNHSNPLWRDGPERAWLAERGFKVGTFGQRWEL